MGCCRRPLVAAVSRLSSSPVPDGQTLRSSSRRKSTCSGVGCDHARAASDRMYHISSCLGKCNWRVVGSSDRDGPLRTGELLSMDRKSNVLPKTVTAGAPKVSCRSSFLA